MAPHQNKNPDQKWKHHIEDEVSEVKQRLTGVETKMDTVVSSIEKLSTATSELAKQFSTDKRTNWGYVIAGAMLFIAFMALITVPIKEDIRQLDEIQQREMRLLDQALQNEFKPRLENIEDHLARLDHELREHENVFAHAGMIGRVEQIDKRLDKVESRIR